MAVRAYAALIEELSAAAGGWRPREIDVGGGFPSPRDPAGRALARRAGAPPPPPIEAFAARRRPAELRRVRRRRTLEAEPGRSLFGDAGLHLTRVLSVKRQTAPAPYTWIETDTSEAFLPGRAARAQRAGPCSPPGGMDEPAALHGDVVGRSCGFDVLAAGAELPAVEAGDLLAILDTGAYQDAASSNFNAMPRPATVLVTRRPPTRLVTAARDPGRRVLPRRRSARAPARPHGRDRRRPRPLAALLPRSARPAGARAGRGRRRRTSRRSRASTARASGSPTSTPAAAASSSSCSTWRRPRRPRRRRPTPPARATWRSRSPTWRRAAERLRAAGVTIRSRGPVAIEDDGDWAGVTCLYATDPDGFTVELIERVGG